MSRKTRELDTRALKEAASVGEAGVRWLNLV